ncbi:hypothetical protein KRR39_02525 [Nocardioides panacis]|uniref:Uncharacterized protein n=1 Tax=Nocardioides panacis TaxID=2849501 RepID=A0A975Y0S0_9ACTN|nr:hypothetical protein [Nocardioides panacis]QWZ08750.1 hypothetical protein KRR39_02525 [Nocardioides panacis]
MGPTAGPALRWCRAALLAAVATGSGAVAHVSSGGLLPGRTAFLLLFAVCLSAAGALLGRRATTLRVVVLLMAGQTFIHGALTAMSGHRGDPPLARTVVPRVPVRAAHVPAGDGRRVGSLYDQLYAQQPGAARTQLTVPAPVQHLLADLTGPHAVMALAHLAAAAVVGLWLARGERALWSIFAIAADGLGAVVCRPLAACVRALAVLAALAHGALDPRARLRPAAGGWRPVRPPASALLTGSLVRRGPPPALLAA